MAITTGNDYDHIAIQNGSNTVLHYFKDNMFRGWANGTESINYMTVNSCTPNSQKTFKLYINDEGSLIVRKGDNWFDVDYYDGEELLHTEEIWTSGANATWSGTPAAKEDENFTYTFLGWATDESAEIVDSNAQTNITSDRSLYAVWQKTEKTVTVEFYDTNNQILKTVEVAKGTSLYDIIANESWDFYITSVYDITDLINNTGSDAIPIYVGDSSTDILTTEAGRTALMNTQIMGNTMYGLMYFVG